MILAADSPVQWFIDLATADFTGWGLFGALVILIVLGAFTEFWVPGRRYRRAEKVGIDAVAALKLSEEQKGALLNYNDLVAHIIHQAAPGTTAPPEADGIDE